MAIHTVVTMGYSVAGGFQGGTATMPTLGFDVSSVVIVSGPFRADAAQVFQPGARAGDVFQSGAHRGEVFQAGAIVGQVQDGKQ